MKPFNLQEALAGKPVVTRDGRSVTDFHVFPTAEYQKVYAVVGGDRVTGFSEKGTYYNNGITNGRDLFMVSEKKEGWVNVWGETRIPAYRKRGYKIFATKQEAEESARAYPYGDPYFGTARLEWEE